MCTVTVLAAQVTDQDAIDPPDNMTVNFLTGFTTIDAQVCGDPATFIHAVQGSGTTSPITGSTVSIEGIVTADYQGAGQFGGYFVQEEDADADADPATSEGIFVFNTSFPVNVGDKVRVRGTVTEFLSSGQTLTELTSVSSVSVCSSGNTVTSTTVNLPIATLSDWERYEGMLINIPQDLTVTETFTLARFGEVSLSVGGRLRNPTNIVAPGAPAILQQDINNRSRILLDDGNNQQNIDPTIHPTGGLSASNTLRSGYTVNGLAGILEQRFGVYRVQPVGPVTFNPTNPRSATPDPVGGNLKVAALNVLNFFTTLDTGTPICGPSGGLDCRGANSAFEFTRQRDKIINAILAINPDIAGLMEVQNDATATIQNLVDGLNDVAGAGTYTYINTGTIGTDAIKVALIYKPANVTPVGAYAILDSSVNPLFIDTKNRPSLAQTFARNATGAKLTVVVNHLKSKGSDCEDVGDPDTGDGQGNCNQTRTQAATALVNWLATDPTGSGDPDFLIVGDMNSYAKEDPITTITSAGYTNLLESLIGADAYSYVFDGQSGYLDHALASSSLVPQTSGVTEWHNNADEPIGLDYNVEFKTANQINTFYTSAPFRASDHDPVLVGLNLNAPPTVDAGGPYNVGEGSSVLVTASGNDLDGGSLTYAWDLDNNGSFETPGQNATFSAATLDGPGSYTINVRVTDAGGLFTVDSATVQVANVAPTVSASFGSNSVSCGSNNATLNVSYTDPGIADTHTAVVNWADGNTQTVNPATSPFSLSHTYAASGLYNVTVTVTDDDGDVGTTTASVAVKFNTIGFQQPINADGTSVFKYNSIIPVKISFTNCNGSVPNNLAPTIKLTLISGATPGLEINEPISTSAADTTGIMRFSTNQYIYNLATKPLPDPSATYLLTVTIPSNGQIVTVPFGLKP
jgi:predicted extracellular nuclease